MSNDDFRQLQIDCSKKPGFNLLFLIQISDNSIIQEVISIKNSSKIILINEFEKIFDEKSYFIICVEYTLVIIKQSDIGQIEQFFRNNDDSTIYCTPSIRKKIEKSCQNSKLIFSHDDQKETFDEDELLPSESIFQKKGRNILFEDFISVILIKRAYKISNINRVKNYKNSSNQIPFSCQTNLETNIYRSKHIYCSTISKISLQYNDWKKKLIIMKKYSNDFFNFYQQEKNSYINLNHPLIPRLYSYYEEERQSTLFIEFINGRTLGDIKELHLKDEEKLNIIFELLITFQYIHSKGYIYCDLKPDNVMIDNNKIAVLIDFNSMIKSTDDPNYVSYEINQFFGDGSANKNNPFSFKSDIYSLGKLIIYIIMEDRIYIEKNKILIKFTDFYSDLKTICEKCIQDDSDKRPTIEQLIRMFYCDMLYKNTINQGIEEKLVSILEDNIKQNDNSEGLFLLGVIYFKGKYVPKNIEKVKNYWEIAASKGNYEAINSLMVFYTDGVYVDKNVDLIIRCLKDAAVNNSPIAFYGLFTIYYLEHYGKRNIRKAIKYLEKSAKLNCREALYELGVFYYYGDCVPQNANKAIELFKKSADQNYPHAQIALGTSYRDGIIVKKDIKKAMYYYKLAAEQNIKLGKEELDNLTNNYNYFEKLNIEANYNNNLEAQYNLGLIYYQGNLVEKDIQIAIYYFTLAAEQNHLDSQMFLGDYYFYYSNDRDFKKAEYYFNLAANQNNERAQFLLGLIYSNAEYGIYDINKSIKYYHLSANQNYYLAQFQLGNIYYQNKLVHRDIEKSIHFYDLAAEQNNDESQKCLGIIYFQGIYVPRDINKAIYYFTLSAKQGNPISQYYLGVIYSNKEFNNYNINKALFYYDQAAKQNEPMSLNNLGKIYIEGILIVKDVDKGIYYYEKSAALNFPIAMYNLACTFFEGKDIKQDIQEAIKYLIRASDFNLHIAQYNLGMIYFEGKYVKFDIKKAIYYLNLSANQLNTSALNCLGCIYYDGKYIQRNINKAISYFTIAANKDNVDAQFNLAKFYSRNDFGSFDMKKAINYYRKASSQNHHKSMFDLAMICYEGIYIERDVKTTIKYLKELSSFKHEYAKNNLGIIYKNGVGVEKNISNAILYFNEAIQKNDIVAIFNLAHIYFYGEGVEKDLDKSMEILTKRTDIFLRLSYDLLKLVLINKYNLISEKIDQNIYDSSSDIIKEELKEIKSWGNLILEFYSYIYKRLKNIELIYHDSSGKLIENKTINNQKSKRNQNLKNLDENFYEGFYDS